MPNPGDTTSARRLGLSGNGRMIWDACPECGKERWVRIKKRGCTCADCWSQKLCLMGARAPKPGSQQREKNNAWKGGAPCVTKNGYRMVRLERGDPYRKMTSNGVYIFEHRLVMAKHLGRLLTPDEQIHHINGDKLDNRIENLELWTRSQPYGVRVADICPNCAELKQEIAELRARIAELEKQRHDD